MKLKNINILNWFKNQKLWKKLLYTFILSTIMPIIVLQTIMVYINTNNMKSTIDEIMKNQLIQISERTSLTLNIYTNLIYQIYSDESIIENINSLYETGKNNKDALNREIYARIQQYGTSVEGISNVIIILNNGEYISYDFSKASIIQTLWANEEELMESSAYKNAKASNNIVITPTERHIRDNQEERIFHLSKRIYDYKSIDVKEIGVVIMSIDENVLNKTCSSGIDTNTKELYSVNFITDKNKNLISYIDPFYAGIKINPNDTIEKFVQNTKKLKNKNLAVNSYVDENLGWVYYNVYDTEYMFSDITKNQKTTIAIGITIMLLSAAMIVYTIFSINKSTKMILIGIDEVQKGNYDGFIDAKIKDEFGQIAENFNTMTKRVKQSIIEVKEATNKQKELEIKVLESQINPHFLYNTLDSINWMAIDKGEYEISKLIRDLGIILRYSINGSNQRVTIKEVVDWLNKYINLQQVRFNYSFKFEINYDDNTSDKKIFKLLIQPFVENAIIHGFKEIKKGGILRIDFHLIEENTLLIIVEDNGKGMKESDILKYNDETNKDAKKGIGLTNSFERMKMYYGEKSTWDISSVYGIGTIITLKIPVD